MATMTCPHCGAANPAGASFCESCGKALPKATDGPRIVDPKSGLASTEAGQSLQAQELQKKVKTAATALLVVAVLQTLATVIFAGIYASQGDSGELAGITADPLVIGVLGAIAALFYGLYFWARKNPLPAAIVGLVVITTLYFLDFLADPASLVRGIIIKAIVIIMLVQAVTAGAQHRKLMRHRAETGRPA
jgi:hypothetical protein